MAPSAAAPAVAANAVLALKAGRDNSYAELQIGQYAPEAGTQIPSDLLRPVETWKVKSLAVALRSEPVADCPAASDIEKALSAPNMRKAERCLFSAELSLVVDKTRRYMVMAACREWLDNVARCRLPGGIGQLWLTRDASTSPKRFNVVLGPSRNDVRFPAAQDAPGHALLLQAAATRGKKPIGPVWLTWPEKSLMLKYTR
jgi:hypothetical protein